MKDSNKDRVGNLRLQSLIDAMASHTVIVDNSGIITAANSAWVAFGLANGLGQADFVGTDYLAVCEKAALNGDGLAREAQVGIEAVLRGETAAFHLEYPCHSPETHRWFTMRVSSLAGDGRLVLIIHDNVTEWVTSRMSATRSEQNFRKMFEGSPTPMAISDAESSRLLNVNSAYLSLFHQTRDEMIGRTALELRQISPADEAELRRLYEAHKHIQGYPVVAYDASRDRRVFSLWAAPMILDDRSCVVTSCYDITDSIEVQERLEALNTQLESKRHELDEKQAALRELLKMMEAERSSFKEAVATNIEKVITPLLRLLGNRLPKSSEHLFSSLDCAVKDIASHFVANLLRAYPHLSNNEILISLLISCGCGSIEIAETLGVSIEAVHKSRLRLRKKLAITHADIRTSDFLRRFSDTEN